MTTTTHRSNGTLEAARRYLARGWMPSPVPPRTKKSETSGWQKLRLAEDDLPRHFPRGSNVGLLLGEPSAGLVDADVDSMEAVRLAHAFLPRTQRVHGRRSKAASHWWYVVDAPPAKAQTAFKDPRKGPAESDAMLVELRSTGGQTLVPPSVHPSGEPYVWDEEGEPARVDLEELLEAVRRLAAAALLARYWPAQGGRHAAAMAVGGLLLRAGLDEEDAARFVEAVAHAAGDEEAGGRAADVRSTARRLAGGGNATGGKTLEDLVGADVVAKVREWLGIAPGRGRGHAPWEAPAPLGRGEVLPPFPVAALPEWLARWVEAEAIATQVPGDLPALVALAVLATAAAKRLDVEVHAGWREPLNLYTLCALPSGNRKSAVVRDATRPILEVERDEARRLAPELAADESARRIKETALRTEETKAAKAAIPDQAALLAGCKRLAQELARLEPRRPLRLLADDVTAERLVTLLAEQGGRMAILSPEGGVFDLMAGRYSSEPNFEVYLKGHPGDSVRVDRVGRPPTHVRAPALTLGIAPQPDVLRGLADQPGFRGRGLLARFLYALPESRVGARDVAAPAMPESTALEYGRRVRALLEIPDEREEDGELRPKILYFDADADSSLMSFQGELEPRLGPEGDLGGICDWGSKLSGAVARLAGLLHVAEHAGEVRAPQRLGADVVARAIEIGRYLIPHALAAFRTMGADPAVEDAKRILAWIERQQRAEFSRREAYQALKGGGRFRRVRDLDPGLEVLAEHGYIHPATPDEPAARGGRKPSERFQVHPEAFERSPNSPNSPRTSEQAPELGETGEMGERGDAWEGDEEPR